jgi:hypothetical protein
MNWKHWLRGLISAITGGASAPTALTVVDREHPHDWSVLASLAGVGALMAVLAYLTKHPLPDDEEGEEGPK